MHTHHLESMATDLVEAGVIKKEEKESAVKALETHWEKRIAIVWGADDVIERSKELGNEVDEEKAVDVLQAMLHHHDCENGITWTTIDCNLE